MLLFLYVQVNWAAKQSFEYVANYKILQTSFAKLHIDKFVDVDRLIRYCYVPWLQGYYCRSPPLAYLVCVSLQWEIYGQP
jgi:hypothetical protein